MDVDEAVSKPVRLSSIHRPALDGTRGLAILLVLLAHTMQSLRYTRGDVTPLELAIGRFFMLGTSGVDLFFVLSGFLITGILLDTKEDANYFIRFYWRRVLRVFPLYYTALAVIGGGFGLAAFLLRHPAIKVSMNPLWYVFYLENFKWQAFDERVAPFWSLAIEEQFYLIWPLTVLRLGRKQLAGVCGTMVAIALLLRVIATAGGNYNQAYYDTPMRMDGLALGAFLAIAVRDPALGDRIRLLGRKVLMPATCFLIASIAIDWSGGPQVLGVPTIGRTCFAIVYGGIVLAAFDGAQQKILPRLLSHSFFRSFGNYSYGIYVWHPSMLWVTRSIVGPWYIKQAPGTRIFVWLLWIPSMIACSWAVGKVSWDFFEARFLRMKDRIPFSAARTRAPREPIIMAVPE